MHDINIIVQYIFVDGNYLLFYNLDMKKFLPLLLICLLMLGLASCSSNESSNSLANQDTQEQTQTQEESVEEIQQEEVIVEEEIKRRNQ